MLRHLRSPFGILVLLSLIVLVVLGLLYPTHTLIADEAHYLEQALYRAIAITPAGLNCATFIPKHTRPATTLQALRCWPDSSSASVQRPVVF
ncbi:MAG: hypothetical protein EP344_09155 [Bacteroidetes bacterium]|nr:MAG: hypothetical protein EP344_09155 [Bacteroidota bacterium]